MAFILRCDDGRGFTERRIKDRAKAETLAEKLRDRGETVTIREVSDRSRRSVMDDVADALGLTKVRGAVSGKVYYE